MKMEGLDVAIAHAKISILLMETSSRAHLNSVSLAKKKTMLPSETSASARLQLMEMASVDPFIRWVRMDAAYYAMSENLVADPTALARLATRWSSMI